MTTKQAEKIEYDRNDDKVILEQIEQTETLAEAMRRSAEIIRERHGKPTTPEKLNSRYYSYIKPHYIDGNEPIEYNKREDRVTSSNGISKLGVLMELASSLSKEETIRFIKELFNGLDVKNRNQKQDAIV